MWSIFIRSFSPLHPAAARTPQRGPDDVGAPFCVILCKHARRRNTGTAHTKRRSVISSRSFAGSGAPMPSFRIHKNNEITAGSYIYKQSCGSSSPFLSCYEIHECRNFHRCPPRFCRFRTLGSTYFTSAQGCICSTRHLSTQQDRLDRWSTSQRYMGYIGCSSKHYQQDRHDFSQEGRTHDKLEFGFKLFHFIGKNSR